MTVRARFTASIQYATVQEALGAATWVDTWKAIHYPNVRPAGTSQSASAVIPPVTDVDNTQPPAYGQFDCVIELEAGAAQQLEDFALEVGTAIGDGQPFQGVQASTSGLTYE